MKTNLLLAVVVCIMCSARAAPAVDEAKPLAYGSYGTRYAGNYEYFFPLNRLHD